jgi:hypothetical protein
MNATKTADGTYKVMINFNNDLDFEEGKEMVVVKLKNESIIESSHELTRYDEIGVLSKIKDGDLV